MLINDTHNAVNTLDWYPQSTTCLILDQQPAWSILVWLSNNTSDQHPVDSRPIHINLLRTSQLLIDYKPRCRWSIRQLSINWGVDGITRVSMKHDWGLIESQLRVSFESIGEHSTTDVCLIDFIVFFWSEIVVFVWESNDMTSLVIPVLLHASLGF